MVISKAGQLRHSTAWPASPDLSHCYLKLTWHICKLADICKRHATRPLIHDLESAPMMRATNVRHAAAVAQWFVLSDAIKHAATHVLRHGSLMTDNTQ